MATPKFKETWKLAEEFVAAEGYDLVKRISKNRQGRDGDFLYQTERIYQPPFVCPYQEASLPDALVEVIVTSSKELSIGATLFLGEFTHLVYSLLPSEVNTISGCLPNLLSYVSSANPERYNYMYASLAVSM